MRRWSRKGSMAGGWATVVVLSLITSQDGQERETPERMLVRRRSRWCAEEAGLLDRGEYIRNVLPPTLYPYYLRPPAGPLCPPPSSSAVSLLV